MFGIDVNKYNILNLKMKYVLQKDCSFYSESYENKKNCHPDLFCYEILIACSFKTPIIAVH